MIFVTTQACLCLIIVMLTGLASAVIWSGIRFILE